MSILINVLLPIVILLWSAYQIYRFVKRSKKGKCAACDCGCEAKRLVEQARKNKA